MDHRKCRYADFSGAPRLGGVRAQRCNFVLQSALNCLNLKWQFIEHIGLGLKRPF